MHNISYDITAIIILFMLLFSIAVRKAVHGRTNHIFLVSIFTAILAAIFDILRYTVKGAPDGAYIVFHTGYLVFHNFQSLIHVLFVMSLLDLWHKMKNSMIVKLLLLVPYGLEFVMLAFNPLSGLMFNVENGVYSHSVAFPLLYFCTGYYLVLDIIMIVKSRRRIDKVKAAGLLSMGTLIVGAVIIHILNPELLVEVFAVALSLFVVSVAVQRPEEYLDTVTGLFKHSAYGHDFKHAFENGRHWHVVMLNIANYDSIYSMIGYDKCTELIAVVAEKIRSLDKKLRGHAELYYLDRGRFRIVFPQSERVIAENFAGMLNNELKMKIRHSGFDINLAPMIVLARCPEEIESFQSLMAFGRDFHEKIPYSGRVMPAAEVYHAEEFLVQNNITAIIDKALSERTFQVYYQPIYSVAEGKFVSAEALLRLFDKEHGFISPEILIPAAERSGAIHKIGEYVFEEVCKFVSSGEFKNLGLDYIEINLSVAQCMHGDLADKILRIMREYNVSPDSINLEITETAASFSQRVMSENLNKLSRAGISFSLDDYGTGYSNMKRVISLPLKLVKLDKSFVDEQHNPKMWIFLQNTVKMLKDMNMEIVVEGIETQEMVDAFSDLKCDFIQGYYFSKAISKDEFVKFISESKEKSEDKKAQ